MKPRILKDLMKPCMLLLGAALLLAAGCQTAGTRTASAGTAQKGAAQLWSENCNRCHNYRSPSSYSDAEWDVATHHMRVRANLTADEHKSIVEFLKSGN